MEPSCASRTAPRAAHASSDRPRRVLAATPPAQYLLSVSAPGFQMQQITIELSATETSSSAIEVQGRSEDLSGIADSATQES